MNHILIEIDFNWTKLITREVFPLIFCFIPLQGLNLSDFDDSRHVEGNMLVGGGVCWERM